MTQLPCIQVALLHDEFSLSQRRPSYDDSQEHLKVRPSFEFSQVPCMHGLLVHGLEISQFAKIKM